MEKPKQYTSIGGQAVIEGVMMRSPRFLAVAVRTPSGDIVVKEKYWRGLLPQWTLAKKPFFRGVLTLIESMVNGIEALSYSANASMADAGAADSSSAQDSTIRESEVLSDFAIFTSIFFAFVMGMGLFVALPHALTLGISYLGPAIGLSEHLDASSFLFHLLDGFFKVCILVLYISGISLMPDIRRVFQYHGAEHKSIYTFEKALTLDVDHSKQQTTLHPRCGTSFILSLLLISIFVFSAFFPLLGAWLKEFSTVPKQVITLGLKVVLMLPIAGISYEFIRFTGRYADQWWVTIFVWPGMLLQKLTTKEPDNEQLEVALVALKRVLFLEKHPDQIKSEEFTYKNPEEIPAVTASVTEFLG